MLLCLTFTLNEQILEFCSYQKQYKIELFPSKQRNAKKKQKYNYFVLLNFNFIFFFGFVVDLIQLTQLYKLVLELNSSFRLSLALGPRLDFEYILANAEVLMIVRCISISFSLRMINFDVRNRGNYFFVKFLVNRSSIKQLLISILLTASSY